MMLLLGKPCPGNPSRKKILWRKPHQEEIRFYLYLLYYSRQGWEGMEDWFTNLSVVPEITQNPCLAAAGWSLVPPLGPSTLLLNRAFQQLHLLKEGLRLTLRSESIKGSFLALWIQHLSVLFYRLCTWHLLWSRVASLCMFYAAVLSNPNEKWQDSSTSFLWLFPSSSPTPIPFFPWALLASLVSVLHLFFWVMSILCNCFWKAAGKHRRADW